MALASASAFVIGFCWTENMPNGNQQAQIVDSFWNGIRLLKEPQIFVLGIVDSLYMSAIQILVFIWTPTLQTTAGSKNINPAMIFVIMIMCILTHNKILELLHKSLRVNYFHLLTCYLFVFMSNYGLIYFVDSYQMRLIFLAILNVN